MMPASERALRAKIAAHASWANTDDPRARTAPARAARQERFVRETRERFGNLPQAELERRAAQLRSAHYARMALKSAATRRKAREARERADRDHAEADEADPEAAAGDDRGDPDNRAA